MNHYFASCRQFIMPFIGSLLAVWSTFGCASTQAASASSVQNSAPGQVSVLREDFHGGDGAWETTGGQWSVVGNRYRAHNSDASADAIATPRRAPLLESQTVESSVRVTQRLTPAGWSLAGIVIAFDPTNFWMLALTEGEDGHRSVDFLENYRGAWQAQADAGPTRLTADTRHGSGAWLPNKDYRLRLQLRPDGIAAAVTDVASSAVIWDGDYKFGTADVVRMGTAGLIARGCQTEFGDVAVSAPADAAAPAGVHIEKGARGNIAMLRAALPGLDTVAVDKIAAALRGAGYGVTFLSADQVTDPAILNPRYFFLYAIPHAEVYPAAGAGALMAYVRRHGHLLILGGPPFTRAVWRYQGEWLDRATIHARLAQRPPEHSFLDFAPGAELTAWTHGTNDPGVRSSLSIDPAGPADQGAALKVSMTDMTGWNTYGAPVTPGMFPPGQQLLTFWAKGDAHTSQLAVEIQEQDHSRWIATVPITSAWTYQVLTPADFHFWHDALTQGERGGPTDQLHPQAANHLVLGLSGSHTAAVGGGPHTFWVAHFGTAANPYAGFSANPANTFMPLETVTPSYKLYPLHDIASFVAAPGQNIIPATLKLPTPTTTFSAIARPSGKGFGGNPRWRWIPLLQALDGAGQQRGTPAWLLLNEGKPWNESAFAVFAIRDQALLAAEPLRSAIVNTVRRLRDGVFLVEGGARQFSYWPGEPVEVGARVMNWGQAPAALRVRLIVTAKTGQARGRQLFAAVAPLNVVAGDSPSLTRSWNPLGHDNTPCEVTVELLRDGRVIDRIAHEIGFLATVTPRHDEFITTRDNNFMLRGRAWYPVGINYWPLYVSGMDGGDYRLGWLMPGYYDPEEVDKDLQRMTRLGMNMVSIQMEGPPAQRNLLDFLRRCATHGIHVNGFLTGASPIGFNESEVADFIRAGRLDQNSTLFAYDIIWEPGNSMFDAAGRERWQPDWQRWIVAQYGSLEAAAADWGFTLPQEGGKVAPPTDQQLREDGNWRVMVAAYRRFMDDLMSHKWRDATTRIRHYDPHHLVSFRQGNTLPQDFALTAPVKHIDFISPEGYSFQGGAKSYNAVGFTNRYVHFTTRGKPIFWAEFGQSVWDKNQMQPDPHLFGAKADYLEMFFKAGLEAGANGLAPWWWPGGYRVDEGSDFGIMNEDGTPRPGAEVVARYAARLKTPRPYPAPDTWLTVDRDADAGGYWHIIFNEGATAYQQARQQGHNLGVRTAGTDTDSVTTPLVAVGNRPANGHNPLKYLNAEFNWLQIQDKTGHWIEAHNGAEIQVAANKPVLARASVGNTQEATWLTTAAAGGKTGAVFLATAAGSDLQLHQPIKANAPYLADADLGQFTLSPTVTGRTHVILQMTAEGRGWFGEKRDFTLVSMP